jgi:hypothetical protein
MVNSLALFLHERDKQPYLEGNPAAIRSVAALDRGGSGAPVSEHTARRRWFCRVWLRSVGEFLARMTCAFKTAGQLTAILPLTWVFS